MRDRGYSSLSEAIRDAISDALSEYDLKRLEQGAVTATVTVITEQERHDVDQCLMRLRHDYNSIISSNMHIHLGSKYCLEIFITEGDVDQVLQFIGRIRVM